MPVNAGGKSMAASLAFLKENRENSVNLGNENG
jgi:hypothetical protein